VDLSNNNSEINRNGKIRDTKSARTRVKTMFMKKSQVSIAEVTTPIGAMSPKLDKD
jgi:hypothetical protein